MKRLALSFIIERLFTTKLFKDAIVLQKVKSSIDYHKFDTNYLLELLLFNINRKGITSRIKDINEFIESLQNKVQLDKTMQLDENVLFDWICKDYTTEYVTEYRDYRLRNNYKKDIISDKFNDETSKLEFSKIIKQLCIDICNSDEDTYISIEDYIEELNKK
jgi:hypothetical protein